MEERLRTQLRNTTAQLQQAQNELAVLKAGGGRQPAARRCARRPADLDALKKELAACPRAAGRPNARRARR